MVDGHHRHIAVDQLHHLRIIKVHTGDHHAVHTPVVAMFQIAHGLAADVVVDKGDIIAALFRFYLEAVQHCGEVLVGQAALLFIYKQNAKVVSTVGFQRPGRCVGQVPHAAGCCTDAFPRGRCDVRLAVQRLTDSCDGYAALFCQILQGRHLMASFQGKELRNVSREFLNRFRNLNIAHSVPKIKRKCKSFSSAASLLAFRFNLTCKNCAFRFTFVTFRLKQKNFRCSFVMVFGVRGCMYILLSKWVSGLSFRVSPVCAAQNAAENRRGCADYF